MKLKILNCGARAVHERISSIDNMFNEVAFSDYDSLVVDPDFVKGSFALAGSPLNADASYLTDVSGSSRRILSRHSTEARDLVGIKGGLLLCILGRTQFELTIRAQDRGSIEARFSPYFLLNSFMEPALRTIPQALAGGSGSEIRYTPGKVIPPYLQMLRNKLRFSSSLQVDFVKNLGGEVLAQDSVGRAVAASFRFGKGILLLVPEPTSAVTKEHLGAALVQTVRFYIEGAEKEEAPAWLTTYTVPGAKVHDSEIRRLSVERDELSRRIQGLEVEKAHLENYRELLYTSGKHILEPAVRRAFRMMGFQVADPEDYEGEWDVDMTSPSGGYFIGEVEGPEGAVDVDKFRQLLNYCSDQAILGLNNKGLLIGNAHRLQEPSQRPPSFTDHAKNGAMKMGYALVATTELFKAVRSLLENGSEDLKEHLRSSLQSCIGEWYYSPLPSPQANLNVTTDAQTGG